MDIQIDDSKNHFSLHDDDFSGEKFKETFLLLKQKVLRTDELIRLYNDKILECERAKSELDATKKLSKRMTSNYNATLTKVIKLELQNSEYRKDIEATATKITEYEIKVAADRQHIEQLICKMKSIEEKHLDNFMQQDIEKSSLKVKIKELEAAARTSKKTYDAKIKRMEKQINCLENGNKKIKTANSKEACSKDASINTVKDDTEFFAKPEVVDKGIMTDEVSYDGDILKKNLLYEEMVMNGLCDVKHGIVKSNVVERGTLTDDFYSIKDDPYPLFCTNCEIRLDPPPIEKICRIMTSCPPLIENVSSDSGLLAAENLVPNNYSPLPTENLVPNNYSPLPTENLVPNNYSPHPTENLVSNNYSPLPTENLVPNNYSPLPTEIMSNVKNSTAFSIRSASSPVAKCTSHSNFTDMSTPLPVVEKLESRIKILERKIKRQVKFKNHFQRNCCQQQMLSTSCCANNTFRMPQPQLSSEVWEKIMLSFIAKEKNTSDNGKPTIKQKLHKINSKRLKQKKRKTIEYTHGTWQIDKVKPIPKCTKGTNKKTKHKKQHSLFNFACDNDSSASDHEPNKLNSADSLSDINSTDNIVMPRILANLTKDDIEKTTQDVHMDNVINEKGIDLVVTQTLSEDDTFIDESMACSNFEKASSKEISMQTTDLHEHDMIETPTSKSEEFLVPSSTSDQVNEITFQLNENHTATEQLLTLHEPQTILDQSDIALERSVNFENLVKVSETQTDSINFGLSINVDSDTTLLKKSTNVGNCTKNSEQSICLTSPDSLINATCEGAIFEKLMDVGPSVKITDPPTCVSGSDPSMNASSKNIIEESMDVRQSMKISKQSTSLFDLDPLTSASSTDTPLERSMGVEQSVQISKQSTNLTDSDSITNCNFDLIALKKSMDNDKSLKSSEQSAYTVDSDLSMKVASEEKLESSKDLYEIEKDCEVHFNKNQAQKESKIVQKRGRPRKRKSLVQSLKKLKAANKINPHLINIASNECTPTQSVKRKADGDTDKRDYIINSVDYTPPEKKRIAHKPKAIITLNASIMSSHTSSTELEDSEELDSSKNEDQNMIHSPKTIENISSDININSLGNMKTELALNVSSVYKSKVVSVPAIFGEMAVHEGEGSKEQANVPGNAISIAIPNFDLTTIDTIQKNKPLKINEDSSIKLYNNACTSLSSSQVLKNTSEETTAQSNKYIKNESSDESKQVSEDFSHENYSNKNCLSADIRQNSDLTNNECNIDQEEGNSIRSNHPGVHDGIKKITIYNPQMCNTPLNAKGIESLIHPKLVIRRQMQKAKKKIKASGITTKFKPINITDECKTENKDNHFEHKLSVIPVDDVPVVMVNTDKQELENILQKQNMACTDIATSSTELIKLKVQKLEETFVKSSETIAQGQPLIDEKNIDTVPKYRVIEKISDKSEESMSPLELLKQFVREQQSCKRKLKKQDCMAHLNKIRKRTDEFIRKQLQRLMDSKWESPCHCDVVEKLSNICSEQIIAKCIIEFLSDKAKCNTNLDNTHTPPAPLLTKAQQRITALLVDLEVKKPLIFKSVQDGIEYKLFRLNEAPLREVIDGLTRIYVVLSCIKKDREKVRIFCCDALYCLGLHAMGILHTVVTCWPEVFPTYRENMELLPKCIAHLILEQKASGVFYKLQPLKALISGLYKYQTCVKMDLLQDILSCLEKKHCNGVNTAIILFAKREEIDWTHKNIIRDSLLPMIIKNKHYSIYNAFSLLGNIMRAFPVDDPKGTVKEIIGQLCDLINSGEVSADYQEGVASALLSLSRHNFNAVVNSVIKWVPEEPLKPKTIAQLKAVFKARPATFWQNYIRKHRHLQNDNTS